MHSIWFYTLSAVAQVMAEVAALFAVFVIFKLDKLNDEIDNFKWVILHNLPGVIDSYELYESSDEEILKRGRQHVATFTDQTFAADFIINNSRSFKFGDKTLGVFERLLGKKKDILYTLRNTLILSVSAISISLIFLAFTAFLGCWSFLLLSIVLILALITLVYIALGIYKISSS